MSEVASRELRNQTRAVLDRVAAGEDVTITVHGRPVAQLVAVERRPRWMPRDQFVRLFDGHRADPGLRHDLRDLLGSETTDDLPW